MVVSTHGEHRCARRAAHVEEYDPGARVAAKLESDEGKENRFPRAGWPDDHHMANVADMGRQAERGRSAGLCLEQRRPGEVTIAMRSGPDRDRTGTRMTSRH